MRIGIYLGERATGDHGEIDFTRLADGRALNGTEASALNLARGLAERGHEVHVFCAAATQNVPSCKELGGARVWWTTEPIVPGLDAHIAVSEPGLLKKAADDHSFRVAWHHLIDFPDAYDPVMVDAWVFVSPMHLDEMTAHADLIRATWMPNGLDPTLFADTPHRPHTLAWISSPDRGLHRLLELWPRIRARVPTASLRIYYRIDPWLELWFGRGDDRPMVQRANYISEALHILGRNGENGVTVMGPVSRRQFAAELSQTAVVPYTYDPVDPMSELFCGAVVDACAAGAVPVISDLDVLGDNFQGIAEVIPGRPGDSAQAWEDAIVRALTDEPWADAIRARARTFAEGLSYAHVAAAWETFLTKRGIHYTAPDSVYQFAAERPPAFEHQVTATAHVEVAKPKLVYVFGQPEPETWRDGMWAAMKLLAADYDITWVNAQLGEAPPAEGDHILLAWGDFESPAERACRHLKARRKVLQMGGMSAPTSPALFWDLIFAETRWHQEYLRQHTGHGNIRVAFGVNTDIYRPDLDAQHEPVFDWITVGHWADWKRQHLFRAKPGRKIAVGERYATANPHQAPPIIEGHLRAGVVVAPYVEPEQLARFYNMSARCYIPASLVGGGERAVLEAKACGIPVEIEPDNPKLQELLDGPVISHHDFARALKEGLR
jgi:glycosyltransferase involved in cell wall biosynthesis